VRPCIALLHTAEPPVPVGAGVVSPADPAYLPTAEESLIPRLDAKEVAAVFSAPFHNFLCAKDEEPLQKAPLPPGHWYEGSWTTWHENRWRMHNFFVPVNNQRITKPRIRDGGLAAIAEQVEDEAEEVGRYRVWGMTARILVDAATVAYGQKPEFPHNSHFGDEKIIEALEKMGRLGPKKRSGSELTQSDMKKAREAAKM
jgi:peroxisomal coenzyme A diphosphatase NUDT7